MASIIPGYEYDIFISYRQKDNKYDGWVTEFVNNLRKELEATFKEEISIYFDVNPRDGILETYNVDKSLENKLKCLIFIPIISQTYCDPRSFAWQNEFISFNKMIKEDVFGSDIRLENGNTASRIFPVKIHDIDATDKSLLETELGGPIRSVEFIYKSSGVNRPLKPDDSRTENLNHTYYRDQINKVANAAKEIITGLKFHDSGQNDLTVRNLKGKSGYVGTNKLNLKIAIWSFLVLLLAASGYMLLHRIIKTAPDDADKSIAVLPFENLSNDPVLGDAMMHEILNHLFKIGGLTIPPSSSSMRFKGSKLSVREIAKELGVSYLLEGNVYSSGENVRIIVRLIRGKDEHLLWTEDYNKARTAPNLLDMQSDVAQHVAENMRVLISPEVKKRIEAKPTLNTEAYTLFLDTYTNWLPFEQAKTNLERAISLDPSYAEAYALLGRYWLVRGGWDGDLNREQVLEKALPFIEKALQLDKNSISAHTAMAELSLYYKWDFESVEREYQIFNQLNPSNSDLSYFFSNYLLASGRFHEAQVITENAFNQNINSSWAFVEMALTYYFDNQPEKALEKIEIAAQVFQDSTFIPMVSIKLWDYLGNYDKTIALFEKKMAWKKLNDLHPFYLGHLGIAYFKTGNLSKSSELLNELLSRMRKSSVGSPSFFAAAIYTARGENDKAIQLLEKGYTTHEVEMYWLKVEPLFKPLHGDKRFQSILAKIGFE